MHRQPTGVRAWRLMTLLVGGALTLLVIGAVGLLIWTFA